MCTTMRRLRRGTQQGRALKMYKRSVTRRIKEIQQAMVTAKKPEVLSCILQQLGSLINIKKAMRI